MSPDLQALLGQVAGVVSLLGFVPYNVEIVQGKTRPNRATWWIWTVVGAMLCASYYASGARHTVWVPVSYVIGPLVTALLSLKYGEGGSSHFDRACLGGSVLSLLAWWLARSPLAALLANLVIDLLGALPTVRKTYCAPEEESLRSWSVFLLADLLNLCAMGSWSVATSLYPIYLFVLALVLVLLMLRPMLARGPVERCRSGWGEALHRVGATLSVARPEPGYERHHDRGPGIEPPPVEGQRI